MLQAILRCLPIDIGHIRTIKIMIGLLGFSLLLQLITFTTPGWLVYRNDEMGQAKYMGLMYDVQCDGGGCKTVPVSEDIWKNGDGQFKYVSWIVEGLVPILFCSVSLFLFLFSLRKPKWREPFFLFCTWILGMATVLQWDLMAPFADMHKMVTAGGGLENYPVPWNVILHSFSAFMTTTVMLASLVILMKKLIGNVMTNDRMEEQFMTNPDQTEAGVRV